VSRVAAFVHTVALLLCAIASWTIAGTIETGVKEEYKSINGTKLFCTTMGRGEPIVVLHGGPGLDHTYLLPQMARLAKKHKLILFDQRACGRSSGSVDTTAMTIDAFVEDVEGVRKAFKIAKMNLLGHSWGALLAMFHAVKYPQHLRSLILVNPTPASSELRLAAFSAMSDRTSPSDSAAMATIRASTGFFKRDPAVMAQFFRLLFRGTFYDRRLADSLTLTFNDDYGEKNKLLQYLNKDPRIQSYDLHSDLNRVQCPTLIVGADFDQSPAKANDLIHKNIKNSELVTIKNCGHFPYIEKPAEFFRTVEDFLTTHSGKQ
jgi:proline iminopeptidase